MMYYFIGFKKEGESYFVIGDFEMLGMKKLVNFEICFIGNGMKKGCQYFMMIGCGQVDWILYGMKGDLKIGNVVDVYFEIQLFKN